MKPLSGQKMPFRDHWGPSLARHRAYVYVNPLKKLSQKTMAPTAKLTVHDLPTPEPESPMRPRKQYRLSTLCATVENPDMKDQYGSSSVPIYQTATFKGVDGDYDYSRSGNPTRSHLGMIFIISPGWLVTSWGSCRTPCR